MTLAIIGTGYVGLVTGACLAETGHTVYCVDKDAKKIANLQSGKLPIYEPGLEDMVRSNQSKKRLYFRTNLPEVLPLVDAVFLAVGTPPKADHSADLSAVVAVSEEIGRHLTRPTVIITKSTVPVGTSELVRETVQSNLKKDIRFSVASNPEFLREGAAVNDFLAPDRIVVGVDTPEAEAVLREIYSYFIQNDHPFIVTTIKSAEVIKYASNAFLATKISFINEIANFCEATGAVIDDVSRGMGYDSRIGHKYLHAGLGYGGSCFPKDVKALISTGAANNCHFELLRAVEAVNEVQRLRLVDKLKARYKSLKGKKVAIWGLAFKAKTDDTREAPARTIIQALQEAGANVCVFDPVVQELDIPVDFSSDKYSCCDGADALLIVTEWEDFLFPDFREIKKRLRKPLIIDGRNIYEPATVKSHAIEYLSIGRPA
jgi:UDPglucose 6-dehydrogenase